MAPPARKFTLDTNIFIRAFRHPRTNADLQLFHHAFAPFELLSAVVAQELRAGACPAQVVALEKNLLHPFERRGRVFTPSYAAWTATGEVLASLIARERMTWSAIHRSFVNDVLLAMSCREAGITLITDNLKDFERIAREREFAFAPPWPAP